MKILISTDNLRKTAEELAEVMVRNNAMGTHGSKIWNGIEARDFVNTIIREVENEDRFGSFLELTYPKTHVRVIVHYDFHETELAEGTIVRDAYIRDILAVDHPWPLRDTDYEALSQELGAAAGIFV